MSISENGDHLKALGFELAMDFFTIFILIVAYKYTYDTLYSGDLISKMNFMKNAFIYLAPGSIEGFRILTSRSREDKYWDGLEFFLSIFSIIIVLILMFLCFCENDKYATWFVILITVYPIRIIASLGFEILKLAEERRR